MIYSQGDYMFRLAQELWPYHRSITGDGVRQTLAVIQRELPELVVHEVPTGTRAFDWSVPSEWVIRSAKLIDPEGNAIIDIGESNLHVVGYSTGIDTYLSLEDLLPHLHSIPDQPDAIPFITSYYNRTWGFCLTHRQKSELTPGMYRVMIDAEHIEGSMTYADLLIPGDTEDEVFLSTYVCHPSLANNELSGPVVATALARWLRSLPKRHYTYRIAFTPESIGAINYAHQHLETLRARVIAGFQLTCIGDDRRFTYLASRNGNTRIDRIAKRVLAKRPNVTSYSYLHRGSDERTYCAPGIDLPLVSLMRSRYGDYPEYHTSLDTLGGVVTATGLQGGFDAIRECIETLELEKVLLTSVYAEPQLGRRGLYHSMLNKGTSDEVLLRTHILAYADGHHSIVDIADSTGEDPKLIGRLAAELLEHDLLKLVFQSNELRPGEPNA